MKPFQLHLYSLAMLSFALIQCATAGQFNLVLSVGDQAPAWSGLEGVDKETHDSGQVASAKCVVIAFTCNSCPYAVDVEDRLIALSKKLTKVGGALVAINVNTIDEDSIEAMRQRADEKGFDFDYLYDPSQKIAKAFGAKTTPEFFVLGQDRKIVYMGALDDSPDGKAVNHRYVDAAIDAVLGGKTVEVNETVPIGCRIRFARTRGR